MTIITNEIVDTLSIYSNYRYLRSKGEGWLFRKFNKSMGEDIYDVYSREIVTLKDHGMIRGSLLGLRYLNKNVDESDLDTIQSLDQCIEFGTQYLTSTPGHEPDTRVVTETEFLNVSSQLNGVSKVIAHLCYYGNCKPEDIGKDKYQLTKLREGLLEVVVTENPKSRRNREIKDPNLWGLTLDHILEVEQLFTGYDDVPSIDRSRIFNDDFDTKRGDDWGGYQYWNFYTSNAFRLFNDRVDLESIATDQGCSVGALKARMDKYANANQGHTLVQKYLTYREENRRKTKN